MPVIDPTSSRTREELRRAAARGDEGPTAEEQSGGSWPLSEIMRLHAGEPQDPTSVSFPFLRRIRRDHMVAMNLHLIEMGILKSPWYMDAGGDARAAAFADNLIRPIYGRLVRTILRYLWAGYSPAVKRFAFVKPDWTYLEGGETKKVWTGAADAVIFKPVRPLKPELCRPKWKDGEFDGIRYDGRYGHGSFIVDGFQSTTIDLVHSCWATHGQEGEDNDLYGKSRVSYCAPIFHMYWYMWAMIGQAFENNADPGPVMRYPQDEPPMKDANGDLISPVQTALTIGRRRRSGSTVAMPSDRYTSYDDRPSTANKWDIEFPKHDTNFNAMMQWIGYLEAAKCQALWQSDQGVTGSAVTGSSSNRNVFEGASDQRSESLYVLMSMIDEFIDNVFIRPAFAMNLPEFKGTIRKKTLGINKDDDDAVKQIFQLVGQQDWRNFGVDVQKIAESKGLPMLDPVERERQLNQAAGQAEQAPTPVVTPTQGRRALVTQTGFGETTYVQLEDGLIEMAEDGDFVASIPKTDHFADKAIVASTRRLRGQAKTYYSGLYEDFAIYVSKRQSLDLADDGTSWVDKLVAGWRPKVERTKTFISRVRGVLASVFDRQSSITSKDLGSKERPNSKTSLRAAKWIEEHGAEMVDGLSDTVRDELRTFLAREVEKDASPKEVAKAIRSEFSGWEDWKADRLALTEVPRGVNFATLAAAESAGVKKVQLLDGDQHDDGCRNRDGKIVSIKDAFKEDLLHPRCALSMLPIVQTNLEVTRHALEDGLMARYDEDTQTVLLSPELDAAGERAYMKALGEDLARRASGNGHHHPEEAVAQ